MTPGAGAVMPGAGAGAADVPADVLWAHALPHLCASDAAALARSCRALWAARPARDALLGAELAALARDLPAFHAWMGGDEGLRIVAGQSDLRFFGLVRAVRAAADAGRGRRERARQALGPAADGGLVRGVASPRVTVPVLVCLVGFACEHLRPHRMWFALLMFDYLKAALPHDPLLRASPSFRHVVLFKAHECLCARGNKPRAIVRRVDASCRRLIAYLGA